MCHFTFLIKEVGRVGFNMATFYYSAVNDDFPDIRNEMSVVRLFLQMVEKWVLKKYIFDPSKCSGHRCSGKLIFKAFEIQTIH